MKISIQQDDITSYIEFEDYDIFEFANHLRNLLYSVWYPEQVNEIMPTEESLSNDFEQVRKEAYDEGYEEGEAANAKSAELIYDEGRQEGYVTAVAEMRETYEPLLKAAAKDSERLDWVLSDAGGFWLSSREDIDKEMEELA